MPSTQKLKTIAVTQKVWDALNHLKKAQEPFYRIIERLILQSVVDVCLDFKLVDNELPLSHTIVFQLGDDPDSLYLFDGSKPGDPQPVTTDKVQELLKQPKPNMAITKADAILIRGLIQVDGFHLGLRDLHKRLQDFVEGSK